jgi:hypothetical protein
MYSFLSALISFFTNKVQLHGTEISMQQKYETVLF